MIQLHQYYLLVQWVQLR